MNTSSAPGSGKPCRFSWCSRRGAHPNPFALRIRFNLVNHNRERDEMKTLRTVVALVTMSAAATALAHGGLANLSVYDRNEGRWLQVYQHQGRAYVVGRPGHEYQIRLNNRLGTEHGPEETVDARSVITGQTASR